MIVLCMVVSSEISGKFLWNVSGNFGKNSGTSPQKLLTKPMYSKKLGFLVDLSNLQFKFVPKLILTYVEHIT